MNELSKVTEIIQDETLLYVVFGEYVDLKIALQTIDETYLIEAKYGKSFHKQYDCRQAIEINIDWNALKVVSEKMKSMKKPLKHRVAFLVSSEEHMQLILAYQTFLVETDIKIGIFFEEKVSKEWLLSD
jgi:hypothetical protein